MPLHRCEPVHRPEPQVDERVALLCSPLPLDLPNINKDILIFQAAYTGNIDRYSRLRRPAPGPDAHVHAQHGILHYTMFAKWYQAEIENNTDSDSVWLRRLIHERFIMNNDLSHITDDTPDVELPLSVHSPDIALASTYAELARRKPQMTAAIARACIVADYEDVYKALDVSLANNSSLDDLVEIAKTSSNPFYLKDLMSRDESHAADESLEHWDYQPSTRPS